MFGCGLRTEFVDENGKPIEYKPGKIAKTITTIWVFSASLSGGIGFGESLRLYRLQEPSSLLCTIACIIFACTGGIPALILVV